MNDRATRTPGEAQNIVATVQTVAERIVQSVGQVIFGKRNEIRLTVLGLLSQGHILLEDIPGVGKTMLARALARSMGIRFSRIQFTPDMLPSDVTGVSIFNQESRQFEFRPGPIFAQIVLADEINRATAKTQSALLEAMEERQVTVDGHTYQMYDPFLIIATQNPIEYEGTFPLPEAQLDRFLIRIQLGYPSPTEELVVLSAQQYEHPINNMRQVVTVQELSAAQAAVRDVYVAEEIKRYIVEIVNATRNHPKVYLGASPRGSLALFRCSQTRAAMAGRDYVLPDDVKALAEVTLAHRIIANDRDENTRIIVQEVLQYTPVPGASAR
ncbi:MAG: MoxR family ATPase [Chloroflexi bacterium]|jgi:MoxR-like ATPase|nr:MAG: ATPase associated with various cellular activities AAA_3 [Chloroflexi bacterium OLB13]MBC6955069.1 MoxR family ATPase [Chloroflexota bacterium]MBV6435678.1 ATPase RavA [Anaerolineae bacterium]MDL1915206.1 MoxR family ATPase [Anaerolineae bacterium CFX4]OQY89232.1 MAG: AAA family ATPase [Anaerolineae bacterium UTCFX2]